MSYILGLTPRILDVLFSEKQIAMTANILLLQLLLLLIIIIILLIIIVLNRFNLYAACVFTK